MYEKLKKISRWSKWSSVNLEQHLEFILSSRSNENDLIWDNLVFSRKHGFKEKIYLEKKRQIFLIWYILFLDGHTGVARSKKCKRMPNKLKLIFEFHKFYYEFCWKIFKTGPQDSKMAISFLFLPNSFKKAEWQLWSRSTPQLSDSDLQM